MSAVICRAYPNGPLATSGEVHRCHPRVAEVAPEEAGSFAQRLPPFKELVEQVQRVRELATDSKLAARKEVPG